MSWNSSNTTQTLRPLTWPSTAFITAVTDDGSEDALASTEIVGSPVIASIVATGLRWASAANTFLTNESLESNRARASAMRLQTAGTDLTPMKSAYIMDQPRIDETVSFTREVFPMRRSP